MSKHKSQKWLNYLASLVLGTCTLFSIPALGTFVPPYTLFQRSTSVGEFESEDMVSVTEMLDISGELKTFAAVWEQADIRSQLARDQFLTVFAPTNEALNSSVQELLRSGNPQELAKFVRNHIVLGEIDPELIAKGGGEVETMGGSTIKIQVNTDAGDVVINDVVRLNYSTDPTLPLQAIDGVIVRIDRTLLSPINIDYNIRSDSKNNSEDAKSGAK